MQNKSRAPQIGRGEGAERQLWRPVQSGVSYMTSWGVDEPCGNPACQQCAGDLLLPVAVLNIFPLHLQDSPLILQSDRNVTVNARNDQGQLTGQLTVGKTNTRYANATVYDCSILPWLQTLSVKSKFNHFILDSHSSCFSCAWILKCCFTAFSSAKYNVIRFH